LCPDDADTPWRILVVFQNHILRPDTEACPGFLSNSLTVVSMQAREIALLCLEISDIAVDHLNPSIEFELAKPVDKGHQRFRRVMPLDGKDANAPQLFVRGATENVKFNALNIHLEEIDRIIVDKLEKVIEVDAIYLFTNRAGVTVQRPFHRPAGAVKTGRAAGCRYRQRMRDNVQLIGVHILLQGGKCGRRRFEAVNGSVGGVCRGIECEDPDIRAEIDDGPARAEVDARDIVHPLPEDFVEYKSLVV